MNESDHPVIEAYCILNKEGYDGVADRLKQWHREQSTFCACDESSVVRTLAKGTPAEREFCECGGLIND